MSDSLRLAIGTVQTEADASPLVLALADLLQKHDWQTQIFHYQCNHSAGYLEKNPSRLNGHHPRPKCRHLDSWLMTPELGRESFWYGASDCDVALLVGKFRNGENGANHSGGSLEELCEWLQLPRLVLLDVAHLTSCCMPAKPCGTAGLLLCGVAQSDVIRWRTTLESLWGVPVVGALPDAPTGRDRCRSAPQNGLPGGFSSLIGDCIPAASDLLRDNLRMETLLNLFGIDDFPKSSPWLYRPSDKLAGLTVAVAYDEAFYEYFPGVLDVLELHGATVVDFSPLHDEALPPGTDVVYLGGGNLLRHATALAANQCLISSLRCHVCHGGRVYAEGEGTAYLCDSIRVSLPGSRTGAGEMLSMAGVLPAVAVKLSGDAPPCPVEIDLSHDSWLGPAGTRLRGYRDASWRFEPFGTLINYAAGSGVELDLLGRQQVIASRLQLNFSAQPNFLSRFSTTDARSHALRATH